VKNIVLSLVVLFVVSLSVQAQSTPPKKEKAKTTTTTTATTANKAKKEKHQAGQKTDKKGCCSEAEAGCADAK
jgi:hypothetical protein